MIFYILYINYMLDLDFCNFIFEMEENEDLSITFELQQMYIV